MQCRKCGGMPVLCKVPVASGWHVTEWCYACGTHASKNAWVKADGIDVQALPERQTAHEPQQQQCRVCGEWRLLERHHLAPRGVFGEESEQWPTVDVCRTCHMRWHLKMQGFGSIGGHKNA